MVTLPYHEERMPDESTPAWRQTLDRHQAALVDALAGQVNAEIESSVQRAVSTALESERAAASAATAAATASAAASASDEARRKLSEQLNQTLRRIRQVSAEHEALQLLLEDSAFAADRAVVLLVESNQASVAAWRGMALRDEAEDNAPIELAEAAALASCVETKDPVVAIATPGEISSLLANALSAAGTDRVYLFPVTARQNTVAVLLAVGSVKAAPLELLCEAVGMKLDGLEVPGQATTPAQPPAPLVQIARVETASAPPDTASHAATWASLTPQEQAMHLRAQRTARVRVAQIRISDAEALRKGVQTSDIYGALRSQIDAAREEFHRACISQTPTMVDYLHLEIVRSLARDDQRLLGGDYPGPLA